MKRWWFHTIILGVLALGVKAHPQTESFSEVAIGIASPGPGVSVMGHAFLLFSTKREKKSESIAFQYNISKVEGEPVPSGVLGEVSNFLGYSKRFMVQEIAGLTMMDRYRLENRSLLLYYLDLSPQQISDLWNHLQKEKELREKNLIKDYSFLDNNCLTEALRAVNTVIPDENQKFTFIDRDRYILSNILKISGAIPLYIKNAPFVASGKISRHPFIKDQEIIQPAVLAMAPEILLLYKNMEKLGQICQFPPAFQKSLSSIAGSPEVRASKAFLDFLKKKTEACTSAEKTEIYGHIVDSIYLLSPDLQVKTRVEDYLP